MKDIAADQDAPEAPAYRPPAITYLGDLADLTRGKQVGAADGTTFLGIDLGS